MLNINDLRIKFKFTDGKGVMKAIVTIEDDGISLKGFRIMESKYKHRCGEFLRIQPPTYGSNHHMSVYFKDRDTWYQVEDMVFDAYQKRRPAPDASWGKKDEDVVDRILEEKK